MSKLIESNKLCRVEKIVISFYFIIQQLKCGHGQGKATQSGLVSFLEN
jgi:hypothetical protein